MGYSGYMGGFRNRFHPFFINARDVAKSQRNANVVIIETHFYWRNYILAIIKSEDLFCKPKKSIWKIACILLKPVENNSWDRWPLCVIQTELKALGRTKWRDGCLVRRSHCSEGSQERGARIWVRSHERTVSRRTWAEGRYKRSCTSRVCHGL